jgi:hypothetical protein
MAFIPETGFMGYINIAGSDTIVRCTDISVNPKQEIKFYDHIIGRVDTMHPSLFGGKKAGTDIRPQNILYRGSTKSYDGSFSFPLTDKNTTSFLNQAINFTSFDLNTAYGCSTGNTFNKCYVDSYTLTATAGDIVSASVSTKACSFSDYTPVNHNDLEPETIITFDNLSFDGFTDIEEDSASFIQRFELSINNKTQYIYVNKSLNPLTIRAGIQEVSATFAFYCPDGKIPRFVEDAANTQQDVIVAINGVAITLSLIALYPELTGVSSGALIRTFTYKGVNMGVEI